MTGRARPEGPASQGPASHAAASGASLSLTREELSRASGLSEEAVEELERFGLLSGQNVVGTVYYDQEALVVAGLAAGFRRYGLEARHLRAYRNLADREASLFEQVVVPLLKQRNPQARAQAADALIELTRLGTGLRSSLLARVLRSLQS
ncbi:MAG: hypothetical protein ACRDYD_09065 [Acidimicrobiales bacterium]